MPKYENPAKKKVNFLQDSLCYWYRLFSASHGKTAESRMDSRQNHKNDSKDDHSVHKVGQSLYNADGQRQIHAEAVKQLHQHGGAGGSNSTENNRSDCGTYHSTRKRNHKRCRKQLPAHGAEGKTLAAGSCRMGRAESAEYKAGNETDDKLHRNIVKRIDITRHAGNESGDQSRNEACSRSEQSGCQNCSDGVQINRKTQQQSNGTAENIDDTAERECREL